MKLAPVILFVYRRDVKKTIDSLLNNNLANQTDLFIYSDGSKNEKDKEDVIIVRDFIKNIYGFKSVTLFNSEKNKGLANSIIDGVTRIINEYGRVIVLEDDLLVSKDFLEYMNNALNYYNNDKMIWSISGFGPNLSCLNKNHKNLYLSPRASSWGWASWKDQWNSVDWICKDFYALKKDLKLRSMFELGGNDMYKMLELQMLGKIDSWAIRWCFSQFLQNKYTVYPVKSKIINLGLYDNKGTHTRNDNHGSISIISESKNKFFLDNYEVSFTKLEIDRKIVSCFKKHHNLKTITQFGFFFKKNGGYEFMYFFWRIARRLLDSTFKFFK